MKRLVTMVMILALVFGSVYGAESATSDGSAFLSELAYQLRLRGWNEGELGTFTEQARLMQWDEARMADPAMVAYALHYGTHDEADISGEMATVRAQLALQLAIETRELERLGYGTQAIAQGAALGVRDITAQIRAEATERTGTPMGPEMGLLVRNSVRNAVAQQQKNAPRNASAGSAGKGSAVTFGQPMTGLGNRPGSNPGGMKK
ncbi:MAG: hypothetical protein VB025_15230 [Sphaerochaeta sp.]|nr:hypothetical protein [Sphaerochaeta sp.]